VSTTDKTRFGELDSNPTPSTIGIGKNDIPGPAICIFLVLKPQDENKSKILKMCSFQNNRNISEEKIEGLAGGCCLLLI
jgi:hypothetical protein